MDKIIRVYKVETGGGRFYERVVEEEQPEFVRKHSSSPPRPARPRTEPRDDEVSR